MDHNKHHDRNEDERIDDQDEPKTANEIIREVNGDPDMNLNDLKRTGDDTISRAESDQLQDTGLSQGAGYTPNDTSAVRSGGTTDMDDQAAGGAGFISGVQHPSGSDLTPKRNVTGSDYDGQTSTSAP